MHRAGQCRQPPHKLARNVTKSKKESPACLEVCLHLPASSVAGNAMRHDQHPQVLRVYQCNSQRRQPSNAIPKPVALHADNRGVGSQPRRRAHHLPAGQQAWRWLLSVKLPACPQPSMPPRIRPAGIGGGIQGRGARPLAWIPSMIAASRVSARRRWFLRASGWNRGWEEGWGACVALACVGDTMEIRWAPPDSVVALGEPEVAAKQGGKGQQRRQHHPSHPQVSNVPARHWRVGGCRPGTCGAAATWPPAPPLSCGQRRRRGKQLTMRCCRTARGLPPPST